jgi:hypothetical protein
VVLQPIDRYALFCTCFGMMARGEYDMMCRYHFVAASRTPDECQCTAYYCSDMKKHLQLNTSQ